MHAHCICCILQQHCRWADACWGGARCNGQLVEAVRAGAAVLTTATRLRSGSMDVGALFHGSTPLGSPQTAARSVVC